MKVIDEGLERFLVVTGHVEDADFVVRSMTGKEEFRLSIDEI